VADFMTYPTRRAGRGARAVLRLVAGALVALALAVFVVVWIGSRNPALAAMILFLTPLAVLVLHDQRRHEQAIEHGRREALAERARREACPDCFGTGVWRGTGWAEPCPTCRGGRR
jgi:hypothetical protein